MIMPDGAPCKFLAVVLKAKEDIIWASALGLLAENNLHIGRIVRSVFLPNFEVRFTARNINLRYARAYDEQGVIS